MNLPADPVFYAVAASAIILVGLAKGGFAGLGAAAMPLLALVMDPVRGAAMLLTILIAQDVVGILSFRKSYDAATLKIMLPGAFVGIFLGWWTAASVSAGMVRGLVGAIAFLFGLYRLLAPNGPALPRSTGLPPLVGTFWGGVAGFTSQVAHAGGPPFQIWALSRNFPHLVFIGTSTIFFSLVNLAKLPAFFALGQFTWANMQLTLLFLPLAILSTLAGVVLVRRISPARFHLAINLLLVAVGAELMRGAFL